MSRIKYLIRDIEEMNKNLQGSIEAYTEDSLPPHVKTALGEVSKNNERISFLNERLFELIEKKASWKASCRENKESCFNVT